MDTKNFKPLDAKTANVTVQNKPAEVKAKEEKVEEIKEVEIKQAVIDIPKKKTIKLKVPGFRGSFAGMKFGDDHITERYVTEENVADLKRQFPNAKIEEVE